jgi:hypothetical protein
MDGYGVEIDANGSVIAFGNGWFEELGAVTSLGLGDWGATDLYGRHVLDVPVNQRALAVQALVRAAGLGSEYVIRDAEPSTSDNATE